DDEVTFFTLRNAIVFFLGFSWSGLACIDTDISIWWAVLVGLIMVLINFLLLQGFDSLNETGNLNLDNAIGKQAIVSIPIPVGGCGKVNISFQSRLEELEAATEYVAISRGQTVTVLRISNNKLIVKAS
ncbi:MAG: NfeD family protein, partial [Candidatus Marithrix sp.]